MLDSTYWPGQKYVIMITYYYNIITIIIRSEMSNYIHLSNNT